MPISRFFLHVVAEVVCAAPQIMFVESVVGMYESIKCNKQISFGEESLNDILFIKINLPPLSTVDLRPVIGKFMTDVHRRTGTTKKENPEAKEVTIQREFYNKFFPDSYKRYRKVAVPQLNKEVDAIDLDTFKDGIHIE